MFNENIKETYERVKGNPRYCEELLTWNSGGNVILTEMPIEYNGMDCFIVLDDDDCISVFINRLTEYDESPYYDEYAVEYFNTDQELPKEIIPYIEKMIKSCKEYYDVWFRELWFQDNYKGKLIEILNKVKEDK